jgi:hypothetical protein
MNVTNLTKRHRCISNMVNTQNDTDIKQYFNKLGRLASVDKVVSNILKADLKYIKQFNSQYGAGLCSSQEANIKPKPRQKTQKELNKEVQEYIKNISKILARQAPNSNSNSNSNSNFNLEKELKKLNNN